MLSKNDFKRSVLEVRDRVELSSNAEIRSQNKAKKKLYGSKTYTAFKIGGDILSQSLEPVPSALRGLTSLFGMGRGGHPCYNHHKTITHGYESIL